MARKKAGVSKVAMVRAAIEKLGWAVPIEDYQAYIKATYGADMSKPHISQTKSTERRRQGVRGKRRRRGRPAKQEQASASPASAKVADILSFLDAVREWEAKIGAETVREVVKSALKK